MIKDLVIFKNTGRRADLPTKLYFLEFLMYHTILSDQNIFLKVELNKLSILISPSSTYFTEKKKGRY